MTDIKKGERFRVGEIWLSPRSYFYRVVEVVGLQATLRMGRNGVGRKVRRSVDAISGWTVTE